MKWIGIVWTVLWNIFVLFIAFAILNSYYLESGEQMIASLLILIYGNLITWHSIQLRTNASYALVAQMRDAKIFRSLGNTEEADYLDEDTQTATDTLKKTEVKFWINMISASIIWIVAGLTLLDNL